VIDTDKSGVEEVGLIGLGVMGRPMASNLLKAGFPLAVHDLNQEAVDSLVGIGARDAGSIAGAGSARIVITMLPDTPDVGSVIFGEGGLAATMRPGSTLIDMSSISPVETRRFAAALAEGGVAMLDAPVSGGFQAAESATFRSWSAAMPACLRNAGWC
jgi:2-hydroxy-3-oxopropionate reductase